MKNLMIALMLLVLCNGCTWREVGANTVGALASVGGAAIGVGDSGANSYAAGQAGSELGDWLFSGGSTTPETKLHPNGYVEKKKVVEEEERSN